MTSNDKRNEEIASLKIRLDAIVALLLKSVFCDEKGKMKMTEAAPFLYQMGFTPSEIAKLLGKKKSTDVAPYLYSKKPQDSKREEPRYKPTTEGGESK